MPKLSIVTPTYNEEKYLPLLLRSVQAQSFTDYEMIVADNDSTDRTPQIARDFGAKLTKGGNPAQGRNNGAAVASGDIILFLDADVILPDPWFLQMTIAEFEKRHLDVATCLLKPMSKKPVDVVFHEAFNYFMWVMQATTPHAPGSCIFVRRRIAEAVGGFNESIRLAEDHEFVKRASDIGKFGLLKTYRIPVSVRRFERDGHMNIAMKYLLAELYMRTKGDITSDIFDYTWGYDKQDLANKKKGKGLLSRFRRNRNKQKE